MPSSSSSSCSSSLSSCSSSSSSAITDLYFVGAANANWDNSSNWDINSGGPGGDGVPDATIKAWFDDNSPDCQLDINAACLELEATALWAEAFTTNDGAPHTLTAEGDISFDGTGAAGNDATLDDAVTLGGNFHVGAALGTYTQHGMELRFTASGNLDIDLTGSASNAIKTIDIDAGATVTLTNSIQVRNDNAASIICADATAILQINGKTITCYTIGTATPFTLNGSTLSGASNGEINFIVTDTASITMPPVSETLFSISTNHTTAGATVTFIAGGNLNIKEINTNEKFDTGTTVFDMDTYNLTLVNALDCNIQAATAGTITTNMGSGTHSVSDIGCAMDNAGDVWNLNLESSTIAITGNQNFTVIGTLNLDAGTSEVQFTGTGAQAITSAGQTLYTVLVNNNGGGLTLLDALDCNTFEIDDGDFDMNTLTITSVSSILIDGDDAITLDGTITMTGDGDFHIGDTISSLTGDPTIVLQGTGNYDIDKTDAYTGLGGSLTCAASGKVTTVTGDGLSLTHFGSNACGQLILGTGTITINKPLSIYGGWANTLDPASAVVDAGATINGTSGWFKGLQIISGNTSHWTVDIPALTLSGTDLYLHIHCRGSKNLTFSLAGNLVAPYVYATTEDGSGALIFNTANFSMQILEELDLGGFGGGAATINFGSSIISCDVFYNSQDITTFNFSTSQWTVTNYWYFETATTVNIDTCSITFTGTGGGFLSVEASGHDFYDLNFNADGITYTLNDQFDAHNIQIQPGTTIKWKEGQTYAIATYSAGDWDGTVAKNVVLESTNPGTQWLLNMPAGVSVSYINVTDSDARPGEDIVAWDGTNTNGGNNDAWLFSSSSSSSSCSCSSCSCSSCSSCSCSSCSCSSCSCSSSFSSCSSCSCSSSFSPWSSCSCSSSFCSCSSCSCSSSYAALIPAVGIVAHGNFEILAQNGNSFLMNSGTGYDGYGNRIYMRDRRLTSPAWPAQCDSDIYGEYAYLCVKMDPVYKLIDYQNHPVTYLVRKTKFETNILFYMVAGTFKIAISDTEFHYPPLDSDDVINGIVIGKVWKADVHAPDMTVRSPYIATKDGTFFAVDGFNVNV